MSIKFQRALPKLLVHEGGFVNHPRDPGGATNFGITQNTYNSWLRNQGSQQKSVREITKEEVAQIYRESYWDVVKGDSLPSGVAYCVFDAAVNSGPGRAIRWLQSVVGARVDGVIGPETLSKTHEANPVELINTYCDNRLSFMRRLPHWDAFKNGWTRRVTEVRKQALEWASGGRVSDSVVEAPGKADKAPDKASSSGEVKGGTVAITGGAGVALSEAAESIQPLAQFSDTLRWVFVALVVAGAAWAIYSKLNSSED